MTEATTTLTRAGAAGRVEALLGLTVHTKNQYPAPNTSSVNVALINATPTATEHKAPELANVSNDDISGIFQSALEATQSEYAELSAEIIALGAVEPDKGSRIHLTPEQQQKLLPVLTRLFNAAFFWGHVRFVAATKFVREKIRTNLGNDVEQLLSIEHYQGVYIGMAGRLEGADSIQEVANVTSLEEICLPNAIGRR